MCIRTIAAAAIAAAALAAAAAAGVCAMRKTRPQPSLTRTVNFKDPIAVVFSGPLGQVVSLSE